MTAHAETVLEFDRVLELVAGKAASPAGRAAVRALRPFDDPADARLELTTVAGVAAFLRERPGRGVPVPPEMDDVFARLKIEGGVLSPEPLWRAGRLLEASGSLADEMDDRPALDPHLVPIRERLHRDADLLERIGRTVDADGSVLDTASRELKRIRSSLNGARNRLVKRLEAFAKSLPERFAVSDASITIREGRYVVPVRREGKGEVGGIVHDESGSGATIFVEPPVAVDGMNEIRDLEREEAREIQRILREISSTLHRLRPELMRAHEGLVRWDSLVARGRAMNEWRAVPPKLRDETEPGFRIVQGRHPLLMVKEDEVVPFDLEMGPEERTLVVSGPNTGGKSVFLKALGLLTMMARCGIVPPVGPETELPGVREIYADIGDEQSIAESLSTFSAHLQTLRTIVERADARSMILIDEMGTGTDPMEGAALARAILETLTERGCLTVVTSHLGQLKSLDSEGSGVVNASLEFDPKRMRPTYRFVKGRPGRSYGLAIARRLGFPGEVLDRAESHVDEGAASVEDLLERLEIREREARELVAKLEVQDAQLERLRTRLEQQRTDLDERERTAGKRAREEARQVLLEAREEVEDAIRQVRSVADESELEEAAKSARRRVEEAAAERQREAEARTRDGIDPAAREQAAALSIGDRVRVGRAGSKGEVVAVDGGRATVLVGAMKMEVSAVELTLIEDGGEEKPKPSARGWSGDLPDASYEIDLRGLRVDEVGLQLQRALDGAILSDLNEVRIIHGKGTGAVKSRVRELLDLDARVADYRNGKPSEGGGGVTMVTFR